MCDFDRYLQKCFTFYLSATLVRSSSYENDKSLSKISFKDTRWTVESVSQLQRLILRTVIVLCHVSLEHGEDITVRCCLILLQALF